MKQKGLEAAQRELDRMREDHEHLRASRDAADAMQRWSDFVGRQQRIYNKLTAASRDNAKSRAWMDQQNNARKADELMNYLQQARHAEEHSLQEIGAEEATTALIAPTDGGMFIRGFEVKDGRADVDGVDQNGQPLIPSQVLAINRFKLVDVTNRGVVYKAPRSHLGRPVSPRNIELICRQVLQQAERMLEEAKLLVQT